MSSEFDAVPPALRVGDLSKEYEIGGFDEARRPRELVRELLHRPWRRRGSAPKSAFWALQDVSFVIRRGEAVGIVGQNGAGKSTLLKILARITYPTTGFIEADGRVGSLLEVGTGFHPELTGRENVFLNGAILGMSQNEVRARLPSILEFAGVERFIDVPVKRYSSGMYVRLAFAVAAHLDAEILLVDEVLAVGDLAFQRRCLDRMQHLAESGRTLLFVSHNLALVSALCHRGLLLDHGRLVHDGNMKDVVSSYLGGIERRSSLSLRVREDRRGAGQVRFTSFGARHASGAIDRTIALGESIELIAGFETAANDGVLGGVEVSFHVYSFGGQPVVNFWSAVNGEELQARDSAGHFVCGVSKWPLLPGRYVVNLHCQVRRELADWVTEAAILDVVEGNFYGGGRTIPEGSGDLVAVEQEWRST